MNIIDLVMPFVIIVLWPLGYVLGRRVRGYAHVFVPFKDPVSLIVLTLCIVVMCVPFIRWGLGFADMITIWILSSGIGFLIGYMIGYCSIQIDIVQVAVHNITEHDMDCYPLVYYYSPDGRLCWQPQGFKDIVKSMIFNVHNPLQLPLGSIYRTRHLHLKTPLMIRQDVDIVDLAGVEVNQYEIRKAHITFKVEARKYTPSPNCTDAPYDWIVRAQEYEDVFVNYSQMQVEAIEAKAALSRAAVRGGGEILTALASKNPSQVFMDDLGIDLRKALSPDIQRKVRKEMHRAENIPIEEEEDDAD